MTKFAYPPAVVFSAYIFFLILFVAAAFLIGMYVVARSRDTERERLELENARLMCKVEHYKRERREAMNKYADAANEAARLKGGKTANETPNQNQSHQRCCHGRSAGGRHHR